MNYDLAHISARLHEARIAQALSQRALSKLAGVPQSHISKIESNQVDLRLSSLIAIATALGLEVTLVPRQAMPAVQSIARQSLPSLRNPRLHATSPLAVDSAPRPAYTLDEED